MAYRERSFEVSLSGLSVPTAISRYQHLSVVIVIVSDPWRRPYSLIQKQSTLKM